MIKLSDTQCILLSTAAQRDSGSLWPLPASLKPGGGTAKAVAALIRIDLAEERATGEAAETSRSDGDQRYGVFITSAGAAAMGIEQEGEGSNAGLLAPAPAPTPAAAPADKPSSKVAGVILLLRRSNGATLPELIEATGWLPHTTRAALTGIRKRGHTVIRDKRDGVTCYRIEASA